jgi:hypothetical protein
MRACAIVESAGAADFGLPVRSFPALRRASKETGRVAADPGMAGSKTATKEQVNRLSRFEN